MVQILHLDDVFSKTLELKASPEEGQQLQQKDEEMRKGKSDKRNEKPKVVVTSKSLTFALAQAKMS